MSAFNDNINSSISFNSKFEEKDDESEVESILKYIPPLVIPQTSIHHFKLVVSQYSKGSYFTDSLVIHK